MSFNKSAVFTAFILAYTLSFAQDNSVGINTNSPNSNAVLELVSPNSDQGFLVPRLSTSQRTSMSLNNQDNGLMVFDTDLDLFFYWNNGSWKAGLGVINVTTAGGDLTGSYPNPVIRTAAVTEPKIADGAISTDKLQNSSVTTDKINNGAVTTQKIADLAVTGNKLENISSISAGTYGTDAFNVLQLTVDQKGRITGISEVIIQIGSANIINGSIQNADIANGTITISKINPQGNTNVVLTVNASGGVQWTDRAEFASSALPFNNIFIGSSSGVTQGLPVTGDISLTNTGTAANAQIQPGVIVNADINASAAINASKIADGTVSNAEFQNINNLDQRVATTNNVTFNDLQVDGTLGLASGTTVNEISIDGTLSDNSDDALPTEQAVKTYVDTEVSDITLTSGSGVTIDVDNSIDLGGDLDQPTTVGITTGNSISFTDGTTANALSIDDAGQITADGNIDAQNGVDVLGGNLNVTNNADVDGTLDVAGQTSLAATGVATNVRGTLDVDEAANFDGNVDAQNGVDVLGGNLNVTNDATITGNTRVDGNFQFDAAGNPVDNIRTDVRATGLTDNNTLVTETAVRSAISGSVTADNGLNEDPDGNIQLGGPLLENTTITNNGFDLVVDGSTGDVTLDQTGLITAGNGIDVTAGDVDITDNLNVTTNADVDGTLDVAGQTSLAATGVATNIRGTLDVDEAANFDGNVDAQNGVDVLGGNLNVTNNADVDGTLDVAGQTSLAATGVATNIRGTLDVDEAANFDGNVDAQNGVDVLGGNLNVTNDATITGNTRVDGNFQFDAAGNPVDNIRTDVRATGLTDNNTLVTETAVRSAISGSVTADNGLNEDPDGNIQLGGPLLENTTITNNGFDLVVDGSTGDVTLDQTGLITAGNGIDVTAGDVDITDNLNVTTNADVDGTLDVAGQTSLAATGVATNIRGTLDVDEAANFDGNVDAQNGVDVLGGNLNVTNNADVDGTLDVAGQTSLAATGVATNIRGTLDVDEAANFDGNVDAQNGVDVLGGNLNVTNDATITGNTRVDGNFQFDAAGNPVDNIRTDVRATGLTDNNTLVTETAVRSAISGSVTADNGLNEDPDGNIQLGGPLLENTTITNNGFDLVVDGSTGDVTLDQTGLITAGNGIDVTAGDVDITDNLNVTTNADVDGTLDVAGQTSLAATGVATNIRGTLDVDEAANFDGNVDAQNGVDVLGGNLNVTNNADVDGTLDVAGQTSLAATGVATNIRGTLDVDEAANFDGNVDAQNGVDVLGGNLNVTNDATITGNTRVDGNFQFDAAGNPVDNIRTDVRATGLTDNNTLVTETAVRSAISASVTADNGLNEDPDGNIQLGGDLLENTTITNNGFDLVVDGSTGDVTLDQTGLITAGNGIDVTAGDVDITDNLNVTTNADVDGTLDVAGQTSLAATGVATNIRGTLDVDEAANFDGNVDAQNGVDVLGGNLNVTNDATITGNTRVDGNFQFDAAGNPVDNIRTDVRATGLTDNNTLVTETAVRSAISGSVTADNGLNEDPDGNIQLGGPLLENTTITNNGFDLVVDGSTGDVTLDQTGLITAGNGIDVTAGDVDITDNLNVTTNADVDGTLDVAGQTSLAATGVATNIRGTLDVDEAANFDGNVDAQNGVDVLGGNLNVTNDATITGNTRVDGNFQFDAAGNPVDNIRTDVRATGLTDNNTLVTETAVRSAISGSVTADNGLNEDPDGNIQLGGPLLENTTITNNGFDLVVDGSTGDVTLDQTGLITAGNGIDVTAGDVDITDNLNVTTNADVDGTLDVAGQTSLAATGVATNIRGTLDVDEAANFDGNVDAQNGVDVLGGNLNVTNNADVDGTLDVAGQTSLAATGVATNIRGTLDVDEAANFDGNVDAQNGVDVLGGNLNVTNDATITGNTRVDGNFQFDAAGNPVDNIRTDVRATGLTDNNTLVTETAVRSAISGSVTADNGLNEDPDGNIQLGGPLLENTTITNNGFDLVVDGSTGDVTLDQTGLITAGNGIDVTAGDVDITDNLNVTTNADVDGTLDVAGQTSLAATGVATNIRGTLDVDEAANFDGNVDAQNGVDVLGGNLNVTNDATITGNTRVDGNFQFDAAGNPVDNIRTDVRATGLTDNNTLVTETAVRSAISGSVTADNGLNEDPDGNIQLGGPLLENTTITNNGFDLVVDGSTGDVTLDQTGLITAGNGIDVTAGDVDITDNLNVTTNADVDGTLDVAGQTSLAATGVATNIRGTLDVDEAANFDGNVDAQNGVDVLGGNLNVTNNADVDGTLDVAGQTSLAATGVATNIRGTLDVDEAANFDGNVDAQNGVDVLGGNLNVTNDATITGNTRVDGNFQFDAAGNPVDNIRTDVRATGLTDNNTLVTETAVRSAISGSVTADNGLNEDPDGNIQLGGPLLENTTITNNGFDLVVDGSTGDVTFDQAGLITAGNGIDVTAGDVDITDNLNVTTNADVDGTLDVAGQTSLAATGVATNIRGTLDVDEAANFDGNVDAQNGVDVLGGNLNVTNNADVDGTLDVAGQTSLAATGVATNIRGTLDVDEAANFDGNVDAQNGVDVLGGNLNVTNDATITGNTRVDGNFQFDAAGNPVDNIRTDVRATGLTDNNTLVTETAVRSAISGSVTADNGLNEDPDGNIQLGGPLLENTTITNNGFDLVVDGSTGDVTLDQTGLITAGNGIDVTAGDVDITDNLNVTANADIDGTLDVAGQTSLAATGVATNIRGTLDVDEAANFDGNVDAQNGVDVLGGNLNVTNDATITGNTRVDGNFQFDAAGNPVDNIRTDVRATGLTDNNTLVTETAVRSAISGSVTADNGLNEDPDGNIQLGGPLLENTTITNNGFDLVVDGSTGDVTLDQTGLITAGNGIDVTAGDVDITDNLNVTTNADVDGTLDVAGQTSLAATGVATNIRGTLDVDEAANFDGNVDAQNGVDVLGGNLNVTNNADVDGTLDVAGQTSLAATGVATNIRGTLDVDEAANFDGNVDAQNGVDVLGGNLNVTNDATITGNTRVDGNFQFDAAGNPVDNIRTDVRATGLTDNNTLVTETAVRSAISGSVTADNGLNEDPDGNIQLGGPLLENTTITNNGFDLVVDGSTGDVTLDQTGLITAGNGIDVTAGDVDITDNLNVTTNADVDGTLDVAGQTSLAATGVATNIRGTLDVDEAANFDGNVDAQNGVDVLGGNLNVTNDATITGNTRVDGNFQFDAAGNPVDNIRTDVRATGLTDNNTLVTETAVRSAISGSVTADNGLNEDPDGNIQLGGPLLENTTITNNGFDLVVDGSTGDVTLDQTGLITAGNGIDVTAGDVDITDNLNVTTNADVDGTLDVAGQTSLAATGVATNIRGTLDVDEAANFDGNVDAQNGVDVLGGNLNVTNNADVDGTLDVAGQTSLAATGVATNIRGTLDVDEAANFDGNVDAQNGVDVLGGNLNVTNNTDVDGTLDVAGQTSLAATGVATNIRGTLDVDEAANFDGNVDAQNGVDVLGGNLNVTNDATITGNTRVDGNFQFDAAGNPVDNIRTDVRATGLTDNNTLVTETAVRSAVESINSNLQTELDDTQTGAGLGTDGSYNTNSGTNYIDAAGSLDAADDLLDAAIAGVQADVDANEVDADATQSELDVTQGGAGLNADGTYTGKTGTNYIDGQASLDAVDLALDAAINTVATSNAGVQTELDDTQTGAGLGTDGSYNTNSGTNYIDAAGSLDAADDLLDAAIAGVQADVDANEVDADATQSELDVTQGGAGLNADGTYTGKTGTNYIDGQASLDAVDLALDAAINTVATSNAGVQTELDDTQTGAGLGTDGSYNTNSGTNYIDVAGSLDAADDLLDAAIAGVQADVDANEVDADATQAELDVTQGGAGLNADGTYTGKTGTNYIDGQASLDAVDLALDAAINTVATSNAGVQTELDDTQTGAGLGTDGSYNTNSGTNYIDAAGSLDAADDLLDAAIAGVQADVDANEVDADATQSELDVTQGGAGLNADGTYTGKTGTNYIDGQASLDAVDLALDAAINTVATSNAGVQTELDDTQTGAGLGTDGSYNTNSGTNYIDGATSLDAADDLLDAAIAGVQADVDANEVDADATQAELDVTQGGAGLNADGTYTGKTGTNYIDGQASLDAVDLALDAAINTVATSNAGVQTELDDTQTGAGLAGDGSYNANTGTNYIDGATSLDAADDLLDAAIAGVQADVDANETDSDNADAAIQTELDAVETGAGLSATGTYVTNTGTNYIDGATSLDNADDLLDAAINTVATSNAGVQTELDDTQTGAGLGTDGSYNTNSGTNYIDAAGSLDAADDLLDAAIAGVQADVDANETDSDNADAAIQTELDAVETGAGLSATGTYVTNTGTNYIDGATSLDNADDLLDAAINTVATSNAGVQTELDDTQTGAGLAGDGSYNANTGTNYIDGATSLDAADDLLDAAIAGVQADVDANEVDADATQAELDVTQGGAGLNADGTYTGKTGTNYIDGQASLDAVDLALDAAINTVATSNAGVQTELDDTQTGAGLAGDGSYNANTGTNYIDAAGSLDAADDLLDAAIAGVQADVDANEVDADATQAELDVTQGGAGLNADGTYTGKTGTNYIDGQASLDAVDLALDAAINTVATSNAGVQTELDDTQTGAGLAGDGSYNANTGTNYIDGATSLDAADDLLDAAIAGVQADVDANETDSDNADAAIQTELDAVETGAGLSATGTYVTNTGTNYIDGATSLDNADDLLDAAINTVATSNAGVQTELDDTQTGAGLGTDGSYNTNSGTNYIDAAGSLDAADDLLDAAIAGVQADVDANEVDADATQAELDVTQGGAGLNADGTYTANGTANYISSSTSLVDADNSLDAQVKINADAIAAGDLTDDQDLSLTGSTLSLTNDGTTVDLSGFLDNTDNQDLTLTANTLSLTNDVSTVDLSGYLDNTDNQDLSLTGNSLSLTNDATPVDLSGYLDNTDSQNLDFTAGVITLSGDPDATSIDLSNYDTDASDDVNNGDSPAAGDISGSYSTGFTVDNVDYANISNLPTNLDTDATDDITTSNIGSLSSNISTSGTLGAGATTVSSLTVSNLAGGTTGGTLTIDGSGTMSVSSDRRLKENIELLQNTLSKLNQLGGYNYNYKADDKKKKQIGVIAQELQKVFPELVKEDDRGYLMVNYQGLIPVLMQAIKEQQLEISQLNQKVVNQESKLSQLESDNKEMKNDLDLIKKMLMGDKTAKEDNK